MTKTDSKSRKIIRRVEDEILDEEYKKFMLLRRPDNLAILQLLRFYGRLRRDINLGELSNEQFLVSRDRLQIIRRGVNHCLRWLSQDLNLPSIALPKPSMEQLNQEVRDLLNWGIQYGILVIDHIVWGKGISVGKVNTQSKTITFEYPLDFNIPSFFFHLASEKVGLQDFTDSVEDTFLSDLERDYPDWTRRFFQRQNGVNISYTLDRDSSSYQGVLSWVRRTVWPQLPPDYDLQGYTLDEFNQFFSALFLHGTYFAWCEDHVNDMQSLTNKKGAYLISFPENEMVSYLTAISGLPQITTQKLLDEFAFDAKNFHATIFNQPFIRTRSGDVIFLAYYFATLDPSRLLASTIKNKKKVYDRIITELEKSYLEEIRKTLESFGYITWKEKSLRDSQNKIIQPDFLVYDNRTQELLVIDYKHTLVPTSLPETLSRFKNLQTDDGAAVKQVKDYLEFVRSNLILVSDALGYTIYVDKIYGLLLFHWSMPIPFYFQKDIGISDWLSLRSLLSSSPQISPDGIMQWVSTRPDLALKVDKTSIGKPEIQVGGWTYISKLAE